MDETQTKFPRFHSVIKLKHDGGKEEMHYPLLYESIPSEFETIAAKELNETEENKKKGMMKLKEILKREAITDVDDYWLLVVLRSCKYNCKKSEAKLKKFLKICDMVIEKLHEVDMKRLERFLDQAAVGLLPYRDKHGRAIIFTTPNVNLDLFDVDEAMLCGLSCMLFAMTFPLTSIAGFAYIGDCTSPSISIFYPIVKAYQRYAMTFLNLPIRIGRINFTNENFIIRWTYNILRPFLSSKVLERISFLGSDVTKLHKLYHPDLLPEEVGGTMSALSQKLYQTEILNFMKEFKSGKLAWNNGRKL